MRRVWVPVLLVALLWAVRAEATRVVDVRVGAHKGYTRVVLELDEAGDYRIRRRSLPSAGGQVTELMVELDATGTFAVGGRRGLVESVRVKARDGGGSVALIRLNVDSPRVADMTLKAPHRIVIDVRPAVRAAATPAPAPKPAAKPAAKPPPKKAAAPPPRPPPAPKVEAGATAGAKAGTVAGSAPPAGTPEGRTPQAATSEWAEGSPRAVADTKPAPAPQLPKRTSPAPAPRRAPATADEEDGGFGFLPIAGIVAVLGGAWLFLRRRSKIDAEAVRDTLPDFPPVEPLGESPTVSEADLSEPSASEAAEPEAIAIPSADADLPAEPGQVIPDGVPVPEETPAPAGLDLHGQPQGGLSEAEAEPEPASADSVFAGVAAGPAAATSDEAGGETERILREIERRLRHIETRIEEAADARERSDRQLAAHTEELRVQRSAIARAQRVLRNLTRPDDGAEPPPSGENPGT